MTFRIGIKVACIATLRTDRPGEPRRGDVGTVTNIYKESDDGELMIELAEFPWPETQKRFAGFRAKWFRPVQERKTDISAFTSLLTPKTTRPKETTSA